MKTEHGTQHVALVAAQKLNLSECSLLFSRNDVILEQLDGCIASAVVALACPMCDSVTGYTFLKSTLFPHSKVGYNGNSAVEKLATKSTNAVC